MYTKGELVEYSTESKIYVREILDPDGSVICRLVEDPDEEKNNPGYTAADILLSHLNR